MKLTLIILFMLLRDLSEGNLLVSKVTSGISEIRLKVVGSGEQSILSDNFVRNYGIPDEVYLEDTKVENITSTVNLTGNKTNIKLKWNSKISSSYWMFYNCENITEIDLSFFDNPEITNLGFMFYNCKSLTSINFLIFILLKLFQWNKCSIGAKN